MNPEDEALLDIIDDAFNESGRKRLRRRRQKRIGFAWKDLMVALGERGITRESILRVVVDQEFLQALMVKGQQRHTLTRGEVDPIVVNEFNLVKSLVAVAERLPSENYE